ncbi:hypothetical protein PAMP_014643 [Pampus punctatissimus]
MAEDVSEETLTDGLTLLVNLGKVLLQSAKQEAEAVQRYESRWRNSCSWRTVTLSHYLGRGQKLLLVLIRHVG